MSSAVEAEQFLERLEQERPGAVDEIVRPLLQPRLTEFIPHRPTPKQAVFLSPALDGVLEALYGGAAGGGKSDALLMGALQHVDVPGYAALILRTSFPELSKPGGLIPRSKEWLGGTSARYNEQRHEWKFPSGATVTFGYLGKRGDEYQYGSTEFQYIALDELTEFPEQQYTFMMTRLRRLVGSEVPLRMRAATNPIGPGKAWVKRRFIDGGAEHGRAFVPARLSDNPYLDQESYERVLREQGFVLVAALLEGRWDVEEEGTKFHRGWFHVAAVDKVPELARLVRWWDLAATEEPKRPAARKIGDPDYTAGVLMGIDRPGRVWILDVLRGRWSEAATEVAVRGTAERDHATWGGRVEVWMEQEPGAGGKITVSHYRRNVLRGFTFHSSPARSMGSKELRANPVAARAEAGDVFLVEGPWVEDFLDEAASFPQGPHDDQVDGASGAYQVLSGRVRGGAMPTGMKRGSHFRGRP